MPKPWDCLEPSSSSSSPATGSYAGISDIAHSPDFPSSSNSYSFNDNLVQQNQIYLPPANSNEIFLRIIEEPIDKFRYRYKIESEKGSHGGLTGINSTSGKGKKTFPAVKLENFRGKEPVYIKASLFTNNHDQHVHKLRGRDCKDGECEMLLGKDMTTVFSSISIEFTKKDEAKQILLTRKQHQSQNKLSSAEQKEVNDYLKEMNMDCVRLGFTAYIQGQTEPLCPIVFSHPIFNSNSSASGDLKIVRISKIAGSCVGGDEVYLLCEKVKKDEVRVRFYEISDSKETIWHADGKFSPADVHHQVAIVFTTPPYIRTDIEDNVEVCVCLERIKDNTRSELLKFTYCVDENIIMSRKRKKMNPEYDYISPKFGNIDDNSFSQTIEECLKESDPHPYREFLPEGSNFEFNWDEIPHVGSQFSHTDEIMNQTDFPFDGMVTDGVSHLGEAQPIIEAQGWDERKIDKEWMERMIPGLTERKSEDDPKEETERRKGKSPERIEGQMSGLLTKSKRKFKGGGTLPVEPQAAHSWNKIGERYEEIVESQACFPSNIRLKETAPLAVETQAFDLLNEKEERDENVKYDTDVDRPLSSNFLTDIGAVLKFLPRLYLPAATEYVCSKIAKIQGSVKEGIDVAREKLFKKKEIHSIICFFRNLMLTCNEDGNNLLHLIISSPGNNFCFIKQLLRLTPDSLDVVNHHNNNFQTPIEMAIMLEKPFTLRALLMKGLEHKRNIKDSKGNTLLHIAVENNSPLCIKEIIEAEVSDLNCRNYEGLTALHIAVVNNSAVMVRMLLEAGANVNTFETKSGRTPLHFAVDRNLYKIVQLLLKKGQPVIRVDQEDFSSMTALELAFENGYSTIVKALLDASANPRVRRKTYYYDRCCTDSSDSEEETKYRKKAFNFEYAEREVLNLAYTEETENDETAILDNADSKESKNAIMQYSATLPREKQLCTLLDPPNTSWKILGLYLGWTDIELSSISILSLSPTKILLDKFMVDSSGDIKKLKEILRMAALNKALAILQDYN